MTKRFNTIVQQLEHIDSLNESIDTEASDIDRTLNEIMSLYGKLYNKTNLMTSMLVDFNRLNRSKDPGNAAVIDAAKRYWSEVQTAVASVPSLRDFARVHLSHLYDAE